MVKQTEVEFLETYLKELQENYQVFEELSWQDLAQTSENTPSNPSPDNYADEEDAEYAAKAKAKHVKSEKDKEHAARLADANGFDGNLFRDLFTSREWNGYKFRLLQRQLKKQIETIPKIIAEIEKPIDKSVILNGQELLTIEQLARKLNMGVSVLRDKNNKGLIPEPIRIGEAGTLYWPIKEIKCWIKKDCPNRQGWELQKQK